ncbi:hypothetical protein NQ314_019348 [Rhamnusium bicolor]|uniref:Uncharacterized protein n=1 Tax=Rhamnusium bicolor TaxID=1586634 RepID=A0AAV8WPP5_9CUCU|nr:hypothetical protein NQ314_019348 [Rhamnusium bicolor]
MLIGYEPIAPRPAKTFLENRLLNCPIFLNMVLITNFDIPKPIYTPHFLVKHIKSVDGLSGCYNGLAPKVCGNLLSAVATQKLLDYLEPPKDEDDYEFDLEEEPTEQQK